MGRFVGCLGRRIIRVAWLWLPLVAIPWPGEAVTVPRPCKAEPTDEAINYGDLLSCEVSLAADSDTFRFAGAVNDKIIILTIRTGGTVQPCIELYGPDGGLVSSACSLSGVANRVDVSLKATGTHTILIRDRTNGATGTYHLNLQRVSPLTRFGTAVRYGQTLTGQTLDVAADLKLFVFAGTDKSKISVQTVRTSGAVQPCIELYAADGALVDSACSLSGTANRIDPTLTQNGTHTLVVRDRTNAATGAYNVTLQCIIGSCTDAIPTSIAAVVSPPARSVAVGAAATAVATITNLGGASGAADATGDRPADPGGADALSCTVVPTSGPLLPFFYQGVDPVTVQAIGSPNTPVNILPGASESVLVSLTPTAPLCPTQVTFGFSCSNTGSADTVTGLNTLLVSAGAQTSCGLRASASVSQPTFAVGQTVVGSGSVTNSGVPGTAADIYAGILRPDASIQFFTSAGVVIGNVADLGSFRPLAVNVPLNAPFSVSESSVFTHQRTAGDMPGAYVFFIAAVRAGALAGAAVAPDQVLSTATAPYTFP